MFCRKCGKQIDDDALFCYYCGTKVEWEDDENTGAADTEVMDNNDTMVLSREQLRQSVAESVARMEAADKASGAAPTDHYSGSSVQGYGDSTVNGYVRGPAPGHSNGPMNGGGNGPAPGHSNGPMNGRANGPAQRHPNGPMNGGGNGPAQRHPNGPMNGGGNGPVPRHPNGPMNGGPNGPVNYYAQGAPHDYGNGGPVKAKSAPKKKKTGMIILIVCIAVLCLAIIGGVIAVVMIQGNKKSQVEAFKSRVEAFEDFLADANYSSIREDVLELLEDCEDAINEKSIKNFEKLEERMAQLQLKLGNISDQIDSLEALKNSYEALFEDNYVVPEEFRAEVDRVMEDIQAAIENGQTDRLEEFKSVLEDMAFDLKQTNITLIDNIKNTVAALDLTDMTDAERNSLEMYLEEIEQYLDENNYKMAFDKAQVYEEYAQSIVGNIEKRLEESRKESEEESRRAESEEESRRQSEEEEKRKESGYICPGSDSRYLTEADLVGLSDWELLLARNEIYARHGRKFKDESIQAYFNSQEWYHGTVDPDSFNTSVFNEYELKNIEFIKAHEK